jgi:hypothetical protein
MEKTRKSSQPIVFDASSTPFLSFISECHMHWLSAQSKLISTAVLCIQRIPIPRRHLATVTHFFDMLNLVAVLDFPSWGAMTVLCLHLLERVHKTYEAILKSHRIVAHSSDTTGHSEQLLRPT